MADFMLIGGRGLATTSKKIYDYLTHYAQNAQILYFPQANADNQKSFASFKGLLCEDSHVSCVFDDELFDYTLLKKRITASKVLFIGGGHTERLMELFKEYQVFELFKECLNRNILIAGVSAGAILLSKFGMGDGVSYYDNFMYYNFKMLEGYGFLPLTFCPHYQKEELVIFDDEVKKYSYNALALEDDVCVIISDFKLRVIKDDLHNSGYLLTRKTDYQLVPLYEEKIYDWND